MASFLRLIVPVLSALASASADNLVSQVDEIWAGARNKHPEFDGNLDGPSHHIAFDDMSSRIRKCRQR